MVNLSALQIRLLGSQIHSFIPYPRHHPPEVTFTQLWVWIEFLVCLFFSTTHIPYFLTGDLKFSTQRYCPEMGLLSLLQSALLSWGINKYSLKVRPKGQKQWIRYSAVPGFLKGTHSQTWPICEVTAVFQSHSCLFSGYLKPPYPMNLVYRIRDVSFFFLAFVFLGPHLLNM